MIECEPATAGSLDCIPNVQASYGVTIAVNGE
jgi:hypothetical protein